ncbi:unnamed protein product [Amoebophrya sp. A120]|nr:unnamed protein product [Amoebophrya sp. A120]|eukprot:GSA120T00005797001.1
MPLCCGKPKKEEPKEPIVSPECFVIPVPGEKDAPTRTIGDKGEPQSRVWLKKLPAGRMTFRCEFDAGFDWLKSVSPKLADCPQWCPTARFGVLESGKMKIKMEDGSEYTINPGDTFFVPPNHLPIFEEKTVVIEFLQEEVPPAPAPEPAKPQEPAAAAPAEPAKTDAEAPAKADAEPADNKV